MVNAGIKFANVDVKISAVLSTNLMGLLAGRLEGEFENSGD